MPIIIFQSTLFGWSLPQCWPVLLRGFVLNPRRIIVVGHLGLCCYRLLSIKQSVKEQTPQVCKSECSAYMD